MSSTFSISESNIIGVSGSSISVSSTPSISAAAAASAFSLNDEPFPRFFTLSLSTKFIRLRSAPTPTPSDMRNAMKRHIPVMIPFCHIFMGLRLRAFFLLFLALFISALPSPDSFGT